jgi:5-methylcytosine-specific restriction endonuclease McrA
VSGKYKPRGRTKEQSNELRKRSWTPEKRAHIAECNTARARLIAANTVEPSHKVCKDCKVEKTLDQFSRKKGYTIPGAGYSPCCKQCVVKRVANWVAVNPDTVAKHRADPRRAEYAKERYQRDRAEVLAAKRLERLKNPELFKQRDRAYALMYPGKARAKGAQRRKSLVRATPHWLTAIQRAQIDEFYELAVAKQMQTDVIQHVDHIVPLQGNGIRGLHVPWNLQILTESENCSKHNKLLEVGS